MRYFSANLRWDPILDPWTQTAEPSSVPTHFVAFVAGRENGPHEIRASDDPRDVGGGVNGQHRAASGEKMRLKGKSLGVFRVPFRRKG